MAAPSVDILKAAGSPVRSPNPIEAKLACSRAVLSNVVWVI
jgi:hypothetical protein